MQRRIRTLVLTPIISPYRIPVFNELATIDDIELKVLFFMENDSRQRKWKVYANEIAFNCDVLPSLGIPLGDRTFAISAGVKRRLGKFPFDVAICGGYDHFTSWQSLYHVHKLGKKFVLWIESTKRDERPDSLLRKHLKQWFFAHSDGYLVSGKASRDYAREFGVPDEKIFVAPDAVDNRYFARLSRPFRAERQKLKADRGYPDFLVLYVGKIAERKGVWDLIRAYERLDTRDDVGLLLVGDGRDMGKYKKYCLSRGLKNVLFEGFVHREDLPFYYGISDVFVLPSLSDPWGLVINEAMACGLPVISSHIPGAVDDLVHDGKNGFVYRAGNVAELLARVASLRLDQELRGQMGKESQEIIRNYSPSHCAEGFAEAARALCRA